MFHKMFGKVGKHSNIYPPNFHPILTKIIGKFRQIPSQKALRKQAPDKSVKMILRKIPK